MNSNYYIVKKSPRLQRRAHLESRLYDKINMASCHKPISIAVAAIQRYLHLPHITQSMR